MFFDESGNFDFSDLGTKHFVVSSYTTTSPSDMVDDLYNVKYSLLSQGHEQECFHATEDKQFVRDSVFKIISKSLGIYDFVSIQKNKLQKDNRNKKYLYTTCVKVLLKKILQREVNIGNTYKQIVVVLDKILTKEERGYTNGVMRSELKRFNTVFHIYFFQTKSDCNAQFADYGSWAKYVSLERSEMRPLSAISCLVSSDTDLSNTHI